MDERRQLGLRGVVLMGVLLASCALALGAAILLRPIRFTSHQEEIAYVLQQRGVAVKQVQLSQTPIDMQNYFAYAEYSIYGADAIITLVDGRVVPGRIDCKVKRNSCYLSLGKLGIINLALPDLDSDNLTVWQDWLDRHLPRFALGTRAGLSVTPALSP